eukprot:ANDGO_05952.mRNA.1 hypothetical protein
MSSSVPKESNSEFSLIDSNDADFKRLEQLSRRLVEEDFSLSNFLSSSSTNNNNNGSGGNSNRGESIEQVEASLLEDFRALAESQSTAVPKSRVRSLYLELLKFGDALLNDRSTVDAFLGRLSPADLDALLNVMQKDPQDIVSFFDGDAQIVDQMRKAKLFRFDAQSRLLSMQNADSGKSDWESIEREMMQVISKRVPGAENRSESVRKAIEVFEANMMLYAQDPEQLIRLANSLPTPAEQNEFLDILFAEYTPDKIQKRIATTSASTAAAAASSSSSSASGAPGSESAAMSVNHRLVAFVFRELLTHLKAFKTNPRKFDPLLARLNIAERAQVDALLEAFWDVPKDSLKM